jgi:hypothetical protein
MQKFVHIALGLVASLDVLLGLIACQIGQQACNSIPLPERDVVRGIEYYPGNFVLGSHIAGAALTQADLGPVYDTIGANIHDCAPPPTGNYSTFLSEGTRLYTIKGYQPWFRLAVIEAASGSAPSISFIEATSNPHARTAGELLPLDNKVDAILLYPHSSFSSAPTSPTPPPLKTVRAQEQVAKLIALFDQTPLQGTPDTGGTIDILVFHFRDGTISGLLYDPTTGWTDRGSVVLPSTFASLLTGDTGEHSLSSRGPGGK